MLNKSFYQMSFWDEDTEMDESPALKRSCAEIEENYSEDNCVVLAGLLCPSCQSGHIQYIGSHNCLICDTAVQRDCIILTNDDEKQC